MKKKLSLGALLCAGLLFSANGLQAGGISTIVDNLTNDVSNSYDMLYQSTVGVAFTVGSQDALLTAVYAEVKAGYLFGVSPFTGTNTTYEAFIDTDAGGTPGSTLYDLGAGVYVGRGLVVSINAPDNTYLNANTTYWLMLENVSPGVMGGWNSIYNPSGTTAGFGQQTTLGWTINADAGQVGYPFDGSNIPLFGLNATPVPEPATCTLAGLGAAALWLRRRRA